jgi:hypothetical protein
MIHLLDIKPWYEVGASIATMLSAGAIVVVIVEYFANRNVRNIQLMQRCIDNFRKWFSDSNRKVDFFYLELLNEELFYFQKGMIQKKVAIEWIEGMLDYIIIKSADGTPLNDYSDQVDIESLDKFNNNKNFFFRIYYFTNTTIANDHKLPLCDDNNHHSKKRQLAKELHNHIKDYKY